MTFDQLIIWGLANWLATTIIVESELTRPIREWVDRKHRRSATAAKFWGYRHTERLWWKARFLCSCHLCAGMWVALAMAAYLPLLGTTHGITGFVLTALGIKAVGHFTLEVVAWLKRRPHILSSAPR